MSSTLIHARETGSVPSRLPRSPRPFETIFFDVPILPPVPLRVGLRVNVHSLTRNGRPAARGLARYHAESTGIEGPIIGVRAMELAITEFVVQNENLDSTTNYAYLTVQHIHGVTVRLETWRWIWRTLSIPFLQHTRHVPLDRNADITPWEYNIERALPNNEPVVEEEYGGEGGESDEM